MTMAGGVASIEHQPDGTSLVQAAFRCDECAWPQFAIAIQPAQRFSSDEAKRWMTGLTDLEWWPAVALGQTFEDVPSEIASAADEAFRCHSIQAYRGATALARAVIEASAKAKGITTGNLHSKIEELEKQQHVRPHIREAAHEVRHLGNEVAHGDFADPVDAEEAEEALALMSEVLQEVFQSPARIARVQAKRAAKKATT